MCGTDICLTLFDRMRQKCVLYCSTSDFTPQITSQLLLPENVQFLSLSYFTNEDYDGLVQGRERKDHTKDSLNAELNDF